jgi:hypothetical protein
MEVISGLAALSGGGGVLYVARRVRRRQELRARIRRHLELCQCELPVERSRLGAPLAALVHAVRMARFVVEVPLVRFTHRVVRDAPWSRRERCDEYDRALSDVRRALWEVVLAARKIGPADAALLADRGVGVRELHRLIFAPGILERTDDPWEQVLYPVEPDLEAAEEALGGALHELVRLEEAILAPSGAPYR